MITKCEIICIIYWKLNLLYFTYCLILFICCWICHRDFDILQFWTFRTNLTVLQVRPPKCECAHQQSTLDKMCGNASLNTYKNFGKRTRRRCFRFLNLCIFIKLWVLSFVIVAFIDFLNATYIKVIMINLELFF